MTETRRTGRSASGGLAKGRAFRLQVSHAARVPTGDPAREAADLRAALAAAGADLTVMMASIEGAGADMLAFQVAMLEDYALTEGAFHAIDAGIDADHAWREAMAAEIAGYESAEDEYFRARASDLADIRERVSQHLAGGGSSSAPPPGAVILDEDLTPSRFLAIDWRSGGAIVLGAGSASSHVAMLARARGIPMIVGLGALPETPDLALVDADKGVVIFEPSPQTQADFDRKLEAAARERAMIEPFRLKPAKTATGESVQVLINVAEPEELDAIDPAICDGVGLTRTEFLFHSGAGLPDEDTQTRVYAKIAAWAKGRPVTIRTLDAGGDKPIEGLTIAETNPFLGLRGIRLSLARQDVFRVQLRALARAAVAGNIKVMLPMVSRPEEIAETARLLDAEIKALKASGVACARPALGIMVEVPVAALRAADFPADFYSIGSNDLTQYTMAASRDSAEVATLNDAADPGVLALIAMTVKAAEARGVEVSLCGDAGADIAILPKLLDAGLRAVSVSPFAVARVKAAISRYGAPHQP